MEKSWKLMPTKFHTCDRKCPPVGVWRDRDLRMTHHEQAYILASVLVSTMRHITRYSISSQFSQSVEGKKKKKKNPPFSGHAHRAASEASLSYSRKLLVGASLAQ